MRRVQLQAINVDQKKKEKRKKQRNAMHFDQFNNLLIL